MSKENVMEILDKLEFFGGQRAGRELWADKPKEIQDKDIEDFCRDLQIVRSALNDAEPARHGHWIDERDGKYANPRYICSNCKGKALYDFVRDELGNWKEVQVLTEHCPHCGARNEVQYE